MVENMLLKILESSVCWNDVYNSLNESTRFVNSKLTGTLFELFCKYYYLAEPSVYREYKNVWLFTEVPPNVRLKLNVGRKDFGIDLVLERNDGSLDAVQCKFRKNEKSIVSWTKDSLPNFYIEGDQAHTLILFTNASGIDDHSQEKLQNRLKLAGITDLQNISCATLKNMKKLLMGTPADPIQKKPRLYQSEIIDSVVKGLDSCDRGKLILPCGAGKTLVSLWVMESMRPAHTLILVPSLALLRQIKNEWTTNATHHIPYICVCSEKDMDKRDGMHSSIHEISGKVSTDPIEIHAFLTGHSKTVVYATYQSLHAICTAMNTSGFSFDLAICDEAHKTAGSKSSSFGMIHHERHISVKKRLYMTATPRIFSAKMKSGFTEATMQYISDMNDVDVYGNELYRMSFREAIEQEILVDYQIVAIGVSNRELADAMVQRRYISETETLDEIASNFALDKFMIQHGTTHAITFHSSVRKAKNFQARHQKIYSYMTVHHVNGSQSTSERSKLLKDFENDSISIITNARCLTEGVDIPSVDVVYFCDPKSSATDIVQAAGRALRRADHKGKRCGYIIIPIFHHDWESVEDIIENSSFKHLVSVVRAMYSHDERLVDEIRNIKLGQGKRILKEQDFSKDIFETIIMHGFDEKLKDALFSQIIEKSKIPWRNFEKSREFVCMLELKSKAEWAKYAQSGIKPDDIPSTPEKIYKEGGWKGWGNWLGTGRIADQNKIYRPFLEAREFVRNLELKNRAEWEKYARSGNKPEDIPSCPDNTYKKDGWKGLGDWLGTRWIPQKDRTYRPFSDAREFARQLGLKSGSEWRKYCKNRQKPEDIPSCPENIYKKDGWKGWGDWLGTGTTAPRYRKYRPFFEAREFARKLGLKNGDEWTEYARSGKKPEDIPMSLYRTYKKDGWKGMGDWLGTGRIANKDRTYRPFSDAREFARKLGLKSGSEWKKYSGSDNKPEDIPSYPNDIYKDSGWKGWGDWLGTGIIPTYERAYRPFQEAREFARQLELKSGSEWRKYVKSGNKPEDIPAKPDRRYKENGWISWGDWLGTGTIAPQYRDYRSFQEAREFARKLGLKSGAEWKKYVKRGNMPEDIPLCPHYIYKHEGWKGWGDWLGTGTIAPRYRTYRSFLEAREFVRKLGLKNRAEWEKYARSGNKPDDIPMCPNNTFKNEGWKGMGDWLGTGTIANKDRTYRLFSDAREFARNLGLKSISEWRNYFKNGNKPDDIPLCPDHIYKDSGWKGWGDWIGTERIANQQRLFRPFSEAREFVRQLGLKSTSEWSVYVKSRVNPDDIPSNPYRTYKENGWQGWGDWLGTGKIVDQNKTCRPFTEAREFARKLGLKNRAEWEKYAKKKSSNQNEIE